MEILLKDILINREKTSIEEVERICQEEYGIPISTPEEKIIQRKKLYEEIMNSQKNKPEIDSKKLLNEVKHISNMLSLL